MPIIIDNKENCVGCGACLAVCPMNCISLKADHEGFLYPYVNNESCVKCQRCVKVCPLKSVMANKSVEPIAWAMQNISEDIRSKSSSGGIFSILAQYILDSNGVVFGAAFDKNYQVKHICVKNSEHLYILRGSKYVQSEIGEVYNQIEEYLQADKKVLFTGTACQVAAVLSFFGNKRNNLYTLEVVCHGVPSPLVWDKFLKYRSKKAKSSIKQINFRYKNPSWERYAIKLDFENGKEYICDHRLDPYMKSFIRNLSLRPSCYACKFKEYKSVADIILGDLWGIGELAKELDDKKGTSLVIANSEKGAELLNEISEKAVKVPINLKSAEVFNSALMKSPKKPVAREKFLLGLTSQNFEKRVKKFCEPSIIKRMKNKVYAILKKIKVRWRK